jgi:glycosyltransferase involved in cell wall biosynthesis
MDKIKKIYYLSGTALPTDKAHGWQIVKTCQALSQQGIDLTLLAPRRGELDLETYYHLKIDFKMKWSSVVLAPELGRFGYWWSAWKFSWWSLSEIKKVQPDLILVRDPLPALVATWSGLPVWWEIHEPKSNWFFRLVSKRVFGIIAISGGIKDYLIKELAVPTIKISIVPDAADVELIQSLSDDKNFWRTKLKLPLDKKIVLYTGHLYDWKGADTLATTAKFLSADTLVVLVGGTKIDLDNFQARFGSITNLLLVGHRDALEIPEWLKAADVLVLPNSAKQLISRSFTSPLKLFEYLAAGRPIIASDLPSIREILTEQTGFFVPADDPPALAEVIKLALNNDRLATDKAQQAALMAREFSWPKRAEHLIKIFNK